MTDIKKIKKKKRRLHFFVDGDTENDGKLYILATGRTLFQEILMRFITGVGVGATIMIIKGLTEI